MKSVHYAHPMCTSVSPRQHFNHFLITAISTLNGLRLIILCIRNGDATPITGAELQGTKHGRRSGKSLLRTRPCFALVVVLNLMGTIADSEQQFASPSPLRRPKSQTFLIFPHLTFFWPPLRSRREGAISAIRFCLKCNRRVLSAYTSLDRLVAPCAGPLSK